VFAKATGRVPDPLLAPLPAAAYGQVAMRDAVPLLHRLAPLNAWGSPVYCREAASMEAQGMAFGIVVYQYEARLPAC
jgi:hypothetical protein